MEYLTGLAMVVTGGGGGIISSGWKAEALCLRKPVSWVRVRGTGDTCGRQTKRINRSSFDRCGAYILD